MEKISFSNNGQWTLESPLSKGSSRRLAPKPAGHIMSDNEDAYNADDNKSNNFRSGMHILKQLINANPHAVKSVDGVAHVLLHRGIRGDKTEKPSNLDFDKMKVHDDGSLEHGGHGMYTPDHSYASQFSEDRKNPQSVWVPVNKINSSANYIHSNGFNHAYANPSPDVEGGETDDEFREMLDDHDQTTFHNQKSLNADHVVVKPGKYQHASADEMKKFLAHKEENPY